MNNNAFGAWLSSEQKKRKLSDTKLAALLGVTAPAVSRWKSGSAKPRDASLLDTIADLFGEDRSKVYMLAGRGQLGMEIPNADPEVIVFAEYLNNLLSAIEDERIREFAISRVKANLSELNSLIEQVSDMVESTPEETP